MRDYDELVNALRGFDVCQSCPCETPEMCNENDCMVWQAADAIEELVAAVPKWISVEERLPELYKPCFVTYVGFNTKSLISDMIAYRDGDGDWCWWDGEFPSGELCKVKITHWMPLPKPPKEELNKNVE